MKICAVVVWFNPEKSFVKNIATYGVEKIYLVDNSETDNSALLDGVKNAVYMANKKNLGIAKALNIGCRKALDDGFEFCMTMDQDSFFDEGETKKYFAKIQEKSAEDESIKSFAPTIRSTTRPPLIERMKGIVKRKIFRREQKNADGFVTNCICSGNVISLSAFEKTGGFYEPLFIDEVDHEFCYRLQRHGFKIYHFADVSLNHSIGTQKSTIFPSNNHGDTRLFYILRNSLFVQEIYPDFAAELNYKRYIYLYKKRAFLYDHPFWKWIKLAKIVKNAERESKILIENFKKENSR
jgi:rhamnosyltransferase